MLTSLSNLRKNNMHKLSQNLIYVDTSNIPNVKFWTRVKTF